MIYLFKTHYSPRGRSIIQINDKTKEGEISYIPNLVDICLKNNIKQCFLVEDSLAGIWPAFKTLSSEKIDLVFGFRVDFVDNPEDKTDSSNKSAHKNIIFIKNEKGYKDLIKISSKAHVDYFHKIPRLGYNYIHSIWNDNLVMAVPFYDSFLYNNLFTSNVCIPDFRSIKPTMFYEGHNTPFKDILYKACDNYSKQNNLEMLEVKSVYYESSDQFIAWQSRKILANRGHGKENSIMCPNLEHCSIDTFCINEL